METTHDSLLKAIKSGNVELVQQLLKSSLNINEIKGFQSILYTAVDFGPQMITTLINHGADINWTLKSYSCHHQISESCFQKILKKLSAFPSSDYPSISLLSLLLSHGANPNEYSSSTSNGMRFTEWIYPIHSLTKQNDVACVKLLLEANAKISINSYHEIEEDTYFRTRETPLHIALFHQNLEMMKLLIEWKADINIKRYDTETKKRGDEDSSLRYTQKTCLHLAIERKKSGVNEISSIEWSEFLY